MASQNRNGMAGCLLNGLIIIAKKTIKINKETLKLSRREPVGTISSSRKVSIESKNPIVKKDAFLRVTNLSS
jgi:hypothetical protein